MTIPWMMNCPHDDEGWCLPCVSQQIETLRHALSDIACTAWDESAAASVARRFQKLANEALDAPIHYEGTSDNGEPS